MSDPSDPLHNMKLGMLWIRYKHLCPTYYNFIALTYNRVVSIILKFYLQSFDVTLIANSILYFCLVAWVVEELSIFDLRSLGFLLNSVNRLIRLRTKASYNSQGSIKWSNKYCMYLHYGLASLDLRNGYLLVIDLATQ